MHGMVCIFLMIAKHLGLEVPPLAAEQLLWDPEVAEHLVDQLLWLETAYISLKYSIPTSGPLPPSHKAARAPWDGRASTAGGCRAGLLEATTAGGGARHGSRGWSTGSAGPWSLGTGLVPRPTEC